MFDRRRPDLGQGVFETLLVVDGHPVELDAHLARLTASLEALFPNRPTPDLSQADVPSERGPYGPLSDGTSVGRDEGGVVQSLRVTVAPDAHRGFDRRVAVREVEARLAFDPPPIALHSFGLPGGLGAHKWADRSLLDEAQAKLPDDGLPLIVDLDGALLEASRANVFAVVNGDLLTPPLDGRILPGVTRMRAMEIAGALGIAVRETGLSPEDLFAAEEVFLTGSLRGVERVASLDGAPLPRRGDVSERLGSELSLAWAGAKFG